MTEMTELPHLGSAVRLPDPPAGWFDFAYSVLLDGTLAILRTDRDLPAEFSLWRRRARDGEPVVPRPDVRNARVRVSIFDGVGETSPLELRSAPTMLFGRLADGRWLLVGARAAEGQANAYLFTSTGDEAGEMSLGDGIAHIRFAPNGAIWVGYFDEGVFADASRESASLPVSASGIAGFSAFGEILWSLNSVVGPDLFVADCYAMTADGTAIWSCSYDNFAIVRVVDGDIAWWSNDLTGAKALAVDGQHAVLVGGYKDQSARIALLGLDQQHATELGELRYTPPSADRASLVQGEGPTLHIVGDQIWRRISVAAIREAIGV
jgi:hypothetical protein